MQRDNVDPIQRSHLPTGPYIFTILLSDYRHHFRADPPNVSAFLRGLHSNFPTHRPLIVLVVFARTGTAQDEVREVKPHGDFSVVGMKLLTRTRELERDLVPEWRVKYLDYKVRAPPPPSR